MSDPVDDPANDTADALARELFALVDDINRRSLAAPAPGAAETGAQLSLWSTLTGLDLHMIGVPERDGGAGGDLDQLAVIVRALASYGHSSPLVEAATAAWAVSRLPDPPGGIGTIARLRPDGRAEAPWGRLARWALVLGPEPAPRLVRFAPGAVLAEAENIAGEPADTIAADAAEPLPGLPSRTAVRSRVAVLRAAALIGASRGAYDLTRAHVRRRHQFGRPLAAIPAVRTALGVIRTGLIQAEAAQDRALEAVRERGADGALPAAAAGRVVAARTASETARLSHQLHGALGVTAEYALHRLTRRLWAWRDADGSEREWAAELGALALAAPETEFWEWLTA
ncbi:acyl-CoA dehydrogenase family protein [Actinomadura rugatobispora]|uniref:Acyl-CoA dehydrogenase family protein n=1 Tax=Actinomadura rugatobispora TaxID=1994 RepID=A0ABW0ZVW4_9ACTN|nr:acyl-CoA dehydrogenase family protein [Actinomadura rugatobispora]